MKLRERLRRWRKREERRQAKARLAAALREEIRRRFPETTMVFHSDEDWGDLEFVARIPCPSGAVGDLDLVTDDTEATLFVEGMSAHEHFTAYGPVDPDVYEAATKADRDQFVVTGCCDFLEEVFRDEIVFWAAPDGNGGWHSRDATHSGGTTILLGTSKPPAGPRGAWTWSAPYPASGEGQPETHGH